MFRSESHEPLHFASRAISPDALIFHPWRGEPPRSPKSINMQLLAELGISGSPQPAGRIELKVIQVPLLITPVVSSYRIRAWQHEVPE